MWTHAPDEVIGGRPDGREHARGRRQRAQPHGDEGHSHATPPRCEKGGEGGGHRFNSPVTGHHWPLMSRDNTLLSLHGDHGPRMAQKARVTLPFPPRVRRLTDCNTCNPSLP